MVGAICKTCGKEKKAWGGIEYFRLHPSRNLLLRNVKGLRTGLPLFQFRR
jgi:hypothetical protein